MKRVLVLDANQRSALAVTRSLGKQAITVFTAEETPSALAGSSKYCEQHFTYPSPRKNHEAFIEALNQVVAEQNIDVLLPMTELTTMLLLMHKESFNNAVIPFSNLDVVESLADKSILMKTAKSLDIPVPKTWYVDKFAELPDDLEKFSYPIVLKPNKSWLFHEGEWRRAAVRLASSFSEAMNIFDSDWAFKSHPFMIQECIDGHGAGVFALYDQGESVALFAHRRLREKPPSGGVSVLSESTDVKPLPGSYSQTLLKNAKWHGVAMVEFKVSADGTPYLMEINTRFWGSLQLAINAGVDFPKMLFEIACDDKPEKVSNYKTGVKLRWVLGDLDSLYLTLKDKKISAMTKLGNVLRFFIPSLSTRHEVNQWHDMKPFWFELRQYINDIVGSKDK